MLKCHSKAMVLFHLSELTKCLNVTLKQFEMTLGQLGQGKGFKDGYLNDVQHRTL